MLPQLEESEPYCPHFEAHLHPTVAPQNWSKPHIHQATWCQQAGWLRCKVTRIRSTFLCRMGEWISQDFFDYKSTTKQLKIRRKVNYCSHKSQEWNLMQAYLDQECHQVSIYLLIYCSISQTPFATLPSLNSAFLWVLASTSFLPCMVLLHGMDRGLR